MNRTKPQGKSLSQNFPGVPAVVLTNGVNDALNNVKLECFSQGPSLFVSHLQVPLRQRFRDKFWYCLSQSKVLGIEASYSKPCDFL